MYNFGYRRNFDPLLIILPLIIFGIGLLFLYSASRGMNEIKGVNFTMRQIVWVVTGLIGLIFLINLDFRRILDLTYLYYAIMIIFLITILFVGGARMGAKRWISLGWLTFQPSEFAKLILILTLALYLGNNRHAVRSIRIFLTSCVITGVFFVLIFKEPDLGSAIALIPILFTALIVAGAPTRYILGSVFLGAAATPLFWSLLKDYQKRRLLVFINPNMDPLGAGYTVIQSKIAIGSGGLFGKGWMSGTQNQLNFLPERHTDFIFSVVGEEWGFVGSVVLIFLFSFLVMRILAVSDRSSDFYGKILATSIAAMISFQVIVNIAMTAGLLPVVGLPLPFISYGGSSLITNLLAMAVVINVDIHRTIF